MSQARARKRMLDFRFGERVMFDLDGRAPVFGVLTRYNKQTVTVTTDDGHQWRVSPGFLQKLESVIEAEFEKAVALPAKQQ